MSFDYYCIIGFVGDGGNDRVLLLGMWEWFCGDGVFGVSFFDDFLDFG